MMNSKKTILLVEDDMVDVMTVKRAIRDVSIPNVLAVAGNGEEALEYLKNSENEKPGLILLDLNMPRMNGIEFLSIIKQNEELKMIPVIVLTTSNQERDIVESFKLSVAGYMLKPVDYKEFINVMKNIDSYWSYSIMPN
ncbi:MAG: response regulator [Bacillota bacterium]